SFLKTVLEKDEKDVKAVPLSNNTVNRRLDEMSEDNRIQLVEMLNARKFSMQMDESNLSNSETVLITYVRYIDKMYFAEEMFCKSLGSTTTTNDIYNKLKILRWQ
ncbi:unnamed protein product, partial [Lymnaea stagnalis]